MSKLTFKVSDPTTEIGTNLSGEPVVITFDESGLLETNDITLIDFLMQHDGVERVEAAVRKTKPTEEPK